MDSLFRKEGVGGLTSAQLSGSEENEGGDFSGRRLPPYRFLRRRRRSSVLYFGPQFLLSVDTLTANNCHSAMIDMSLYASVACCSVVLVAWPDAVPPLTIIQIFSAVRRGCLIFHLLSPVARLPSLCRSSMSTDNSSSLRVAKVDCGC